MSVEAKICGLNDPGAVAAAVDGGADYLGFNFFAASPRSVGHDEAAQLGAGAPDGLIKVGVVVDADDGLLARITAGAGIHMLQLHGDETPDRVAEIKALFGLPVIKALPIASADDVEKARAYEDVADWLMFDARPPEGAPRPGGNALAFDWELIRGRHWRLPWFLAGGLDADNVAEAVATSGARAVDVSSGVEDAPGRKSPDKIRAFLQAVAGI